ncbi:MAG: dienelactone hydrolase family protein [Pararhodobacter sp.]
MDRRVTAADGHAFSCWMEPAVGEAKGGLVILQEIFGVTDQLKGVATRYAAQGLTVAIPALFDRQRRDAVIPFDQASEGRALMLSADPEGVMADIAACVAALQAESGKVAVMGFCWGGGLAVRAAQVLDIACAVSFYGTRLEGALGTPLRAPVQGHFGTSDDHTPPDVVTRCQREWPGFEVYWYEAGHAFANEQRPAVYNAAAAGLAHERAAAFILKALA